MTTKINEYINTNTMWRELEKSQNFFVYYAFACANGKTCDCSTWSFRSGRRLTEAERETASFRSSDTEVFGPLVGTAEKRDSKWYVLSHGSLPTDVEEFNAVAQRIAKNYVASICERVDGSMPDGFSEFYSENSEGGR